MAIRKGKTRIIFTLSVKQAKWLENASKEIGISKSRLIRWLIEKNVRNIQQWTTEQELDALIKIARTPWIKDDLLDDEDDEW